MSGMLEKNLWMWMQGVSRQAGFEDGIKNSDDIQNYGKRREDLFENRGEK